ncbi:PQQ-dependent sugar dehydrogenase [Pseudomonas segetis]|uniref:Glucose/arabinose dehydrogenase, beta-propeller fold n=1 Tax=Pseudomonas segetis TaxID=298908 RepID=A0A239IBD7_9PSED|nr:PQQ-dependent sugar dehydrogenase [Pseudomonas segetis]SNS90885.1 Glucose/arabinose dehydrogenase, beta-propeller fold [Pseudomonas segetis]
MIEKARSPSAVLLLACFWLSPASATTDYRIETFTEGLEYPWSMAFLPDGRMLVTERGGRLRIIAASGQLQEQAVGGLPEIYATSQAGLLDVVLDPEFEQNQRIFFSYSYGDRSANNTRLASARLVDGQLQDVKTLFTALPAKAGSSHYGGRIAFLPDNSLLLTLGDGFDYREQAQDLSNHLGKIVRINRDGSVPEDNPFVDVKDAAPEVYSYGHRNVQGIVYAPQLKRVYSHEHGPRGGDELNLIKPGVNYGWPLITYGVDYNGAQISPYTELPGLEQPLLQWTPSVAPSSLMLYSGSGFKYWKGDLFASTLAEKSVRRIRMKNGMLAGQEVLFEELDERIRGVFGGPDGNIYLLTDNAEGRVLKVIPTE